MQSSTFMGVYIQIYIQFNYDSLVPMDMFFFSNLIGWRTSQLVWRMHFSGYFLFQQIPLHIHQQLLTVKIPGSVLWNSQCRNLGWDTHRICKKERRKQLQLGSPWVSFVQSPLLHLVKLSRNAKEFWGCNLILGHNKNSWQHRVCIIRQLRCPETWRTQCWSLSDVFLHLEIMKTFLDILIQTVCLHDKDVQRK